MVVCLLEVTTVLEEVHHVYPEIWNLGLCCMGQIPISSGLGRNLQLMDHSVLISATRDSN